VFALKRRGSCQLAALFFWGKDEGVEDPRAPTLKRLKSGARDADAGPAVSGRSFAFGTAGTLVRSATLGNGLTAMVWPDHKIPNVALYLWVHVGSRNESTGTTGLAHFFEHMMFNGTPRYPQGSFDRLMEARGGSNNAYTSQDVTVYQDWFPRDALQVVLELEADRFANLALIPEVVENERQVVYSERRLRVDDSNAATLEEQVQALAFLAHPYRIPVIGWPSDILSWTMADLRGFHTTYYAPNNCTLVLVGDLDPEATLRQVEDAFGATPAGPPAPRVLTREPQQQGERRLRLPRPGHSPLVQYAYHAIAAADPREPALNLLQTILVGGDASRLNRSLVEEQRLAVAIGGGWPQGFDANLFHLQAALPADQSTDEFEQALDTQLQRLTDSGVTDTELRRAKNIAATDFWRGIATIDGKARLLGEYAVMHGDYRQLFSAPEAYDRVTREDVLAVARAVFCASRRTVGVLQPQGVADTQGDELAQPDGPHA
jgi:zinc protease